MHYETKQPKTKNAKRTIHMIEPLAKEFEEYKVKLLQWKAENGFVHSEDDFGFPSKTNAGLGSRTFYRQCQKILQAADLTDINFHTFRHAFTIKCLKSGMDFLTISKTLGHSGVKITENFYAHIIEEDKAKAADCIASVLLRKNA